ncbi:hypothetical protein Taro_047082 [Colocasia esculenta]|uniref:Uncharacterized protein n=1 Tax=Colocasia esculenta TaxID=4460 RepID=A0A843X6A9_COLES|nr:hypothetical protein [Colocasia esculenta]
MLQTQDKIMQNWSSSVDTRSSSVDTRDSFQKIFWPIWDSVSTLDQISGLMQSEVEKEHIFPAVLFPSAPNLVRLLLSSVIFPISITTRDISCTKLMCNCRGKIDPGSASRYITSVVHAHVPGPVDSWKEFPPSVRELLFDMFTRRYMFTKPEDLPRARVVWESTAQTNWILGFRCGRP